MPARSRTALPFALALGLMALAQPARAQDAMLLPASATAPSLATAAAPAIVAQPAAPAVGPTAATAAVGVQHVSDAGTVATPARAGSAPGTALMIVGGAAVLVGLVVGDDAGYAISIGGAVVGLIGLYQYLQ